MLTVNTTLRTVKIKTVINKNMLKLFIIQPLLPRLLIRLLHNQLYPISWSWCSKSSWNLCWISQRLPLVVAFLLFLSGADGGVCKLKASLTYNYIFLKFFKNANKKTILKVKVTEILCGTSALWFSQLALDARWCMQTKKKQK